MFIAIFTANYRITVSSKLKTNIFRWFESRRIWAAGLVVSELCEIPSHWSQEQTLDSWLKNEGVPGISGIDTRQLTQIIREKGTLLGKIFLGETLPKELGSWDDPNLRNLVAEVSIKVSDIFLKNKFPLIWLYPFYCCVDSKNLQS